MLNSLGLASKPSLSLKHHKNSCLFTSCYISYPFRMINATLLTASLQQTMPQKTQNEALHRRRNRSGWSGHGRTILSQSWDIICVWLLCGLVCRLNCCSKIRQGTYVRKCACITRSVWLTLGSLQGGKASGNSQFEAGEQRERLLTAENS